MLSKHLEGNFIYRCEATFDDLCFKDLNKTRSKAYTKNWGNLKAMTTCVKLCVYSHTCPLSQHALELESWVG